MTGTFTLVESPSDQLDPPWLSRQLPFAPYDKVTGAFYGCDMAEGRDEPQTGDDTFASWLRRARIEAGWGKIAATDELAKVGIRERAYFRWESGEVTKPDPREVRKACLVLGLDTREAAVALGIVTREEMDLPPAPPPIPSTIRNVLSLLRAPQVPEEAKKSLLRHIQAAVEFWAEQLGVPRPPREPSAVERAKGKPVSKR